MSWYRTAFCASGSDSQRHLRFLALQVCRACGQSPRGVVAGRTGLLSLKLGRLTAYVGALPTKPLPSEIGFGPGYQCLCKLFPITLAVWSLSYVFICPS
ncbi:hypothetical protein BDN72DRAFT_388245 [Pluteus cervinus]|uniref:Uncharacterized protein n=1 Tax=Pluteus cervinus TaxID=181527 RepID=A0ACD3B325_9AGAR|nr:hypothetical protein BDN72DRAFT_388245 [Pluteus cervinus]